MTPDWTAVAVNPDCVQGNHRDCSGQTWDWDASDLVPCPCGCHPKYALPETTL